MKTQDDTQSYKHTRVNVGSLNDDVAPPQGMLKHDVETKSIDDEWSPNDDYEFCGEPTLCPKTSNDDNGNDDGCSLTISCNGKIKSWTNFNHTSFRSRQRQKFRPKIINIEFHSATWMSWFVHIKCSIFYKRN